MTREDPPELSEFNTVVEAHCRAGQYRFVRSGPDKDGFLTFNVAVPGIEDPVRLVFHGEVFQLFFPGGYTWGECGHDPDEAREALRDILAFLDAYLDPATREVEVKRLLRAPRRELHVSNGAILRRRGWSKRPTHD